MLDGIDDIPWHSLGHGLDDMSEVPELLRQFLSEDAGTRRRAEDELLGFLWQQGTVYGVAVHVVPYLLELLALPDFPDRDIVISVVATVAEGPGVLEAQARSAARVTSLKQMLAEHGTTLEAELDHELDMATAVRGEVAARVHLLLAGLHSASHIVRCTVASALRWFPASAAELIPSLRAALEHEDDDDVRQALLTSLAVMTAERPA